MFTKSFVSIYFLQEKILTIQLSSRKKKVLKRGEIILPEGLIKDYKVQDVMSLSKILSSFWKKLNIREKIVAVVIPEFSSFTKYFRLPNLPISELNEAVKWQAQEYLPLGVENMILDWKVAKKDENGVDVILVAVEKGILLDYVKAAEVAGLFPMKVETPSICLLRYSEKEEKGVLTLYQDGKDVVLMLSEGGKIIGTSIQYLDDLDSILKTASKMLAYYKEVSVEKVLLGGEGLSQNLEKVASFLKKETNLLSVEISGMDQLDIQKNLIPISSQLEEVEQPSSPITLNLLPNYLVEKYKFRRLKNQVWTLTLTITLFVWVCFFSTLVSYLYMTQNVRNLKSEIESTELSKKSVNPLEEITFINKVSDNVLKIKKATFFPQDILNKIYYLKPVGVKILKYDLDLDKGEVRLQGLAVNRLSLIEFKENLGKDKNFADIDIPISSFEAETNLEFNLTLNYLPIKTTIKDKPIKINPDSIK